MAQLRPQLPYMNFYRFCQLLEKNHPEGADHRQRLAIR